MKNAESSLSSTSVGNSNPSVQNAKFDAAIWFPVFDSFFLIENGFEFIRPVHPYVEPSHTVALILQHTSLACRYPDPVLGAVVVWDINGIDQVAWFAFDHAMRGPAFEGDSVNDYAFVDAIVHGFHEIGGGIRIANNDILGGHRPGHWCGKNEAKSVDIGLFDHELGIFG